MRVRRRKRAANGTVQPVGRRGIYLLPNLLTTAGLFLGFFAIVQATKGHFEWSAGAIFIAMVMDGLDGRIARWTRTTSDFGQEYDSLSDMVAFGLAPALVIYEWSLINMGKLGWLAAFLYVAAAGLRLARFNTQELPDKRFFQGLPSPAAAAVIAGWVWVMESYPLDGRDYQVLSALLTTAVAVAMVSPVRYRSFKDFNIKGKVPFFVLLIPVMALVFVVYDPPRVLFSGFFAYFISGPGLFVWNWLRRGQKAKVATEKKTDSKT